MKDYTGVKNNMLTGIKYIRTENNKTYWLVSCDCGNEKIMLSNKAFLKNSKTKSCGCLRNSINSKNPALNFKISSYKRGAKIRNIDYDISDELFEKTTSSDCFYCGINPLQVSKRYNKIYVYNGIDRINNSIGYIENNIVPCCSICNKAKRDLGIDVFYEWIERLSKYQLKLK